MPVTALPGSPKSLPAPAFDDEGSDSDCESIPRVLKCPLTLRTFVKPVVMGDGFTYEEAEARRFLKVHKAEAELISPLSREPFSSRALIPNRIVISIIEDNPAASRSRKSGLARLPPSPVANPPQEDAFVAEAAPLPHATTGGSSSEPGESSWDYDRAALMGCGAGAIGAVLGKVASAAFARIADDSRGSVAVPGIVGLALAMHGAVAELRHESPRETLRLALAYAQAGLGCLSAAALGAVMAGRVAGTPCAWSPMARVQNCAEESQQDCAPEVCLLGANLGVLAAMAPAGYHVFMAAKPLALRVIDSTTMFLARLVITGQPGLGFSPHG